MGEARIRFQLPPGVSVDQLPVHPAKVGASGVEIRTDKAVEVLAALTTWALREGVDLHGLTVERMTLEDVYLRLTGYQPESAVAVGT